MVTLQNHVLLNAWHTADATLSATLRLAQCGTYNTPVSDMRQSQSQSVVSHPSSILNHLAALVVLTSLKFLPLSLCSEMTKVSTHFIPAQ